MFKLSQALFICLPLLLLGCASFERNLARDVIASGQVELNRCVVTGYQYPGLKDEIGKNRALKVMMIHGVGIHYPGYSEQLQQNLAVKLNLDVISRESKNIKLLDPVDNKTPLGNLRITFWQSRDATRNMMFYELTWSEITMPYKKILAFDTTEQYSKFRVPFNNMMKEFLDNTLPDPLVYVADPRDLIQKSGSQAICWMLKTDWKNIPDNQTKTCAISTDEKISALASQTPMFITHSLGSEILINDLTTMAENIASESTLPGALKAVEKLQKQEITIFMLANQLPILQLTRPLPQIHNQIKNYCSATGKNFRHRIFKAVNIIAFSDPNDILSYAIPQNFADKYLDSRICPQVTNVSVNVAPEISAFGVGIVNPVAAHVDYDRNPKVINLISKGTQNYSHETELEQQCRFLLLKDDKYFYKY